MIENSFLSDIRGDKQRQVARLMMKQIKQPILKEISLTKNQFHAKVEAGIRISADISPQSQSRISSVEPTVNTISSKFPTENVLKQGPRILTESSCEEYIEKKKQPHFGEWRLGPSENSRFDAIQDMIGHYTKVFQERIKFSKGMKGRGDSFKLQEKEVISKIYRQIANQRQNTVNFSSIQKFFQECPLFYRIYNIHPDSLRDVLNDSSHHFQSKLTEQQFMNLFLLNNRESHQYQSYNIEKTLKKCILSQQSWKNLKQIFEIYDTFGNETIQMKQFFQKLRISHQFKHLLNENVIQFPSIKRQYSLKKILFELQNKLKIGEDYYQWSNIRQIIQNFSHIKHPTIDVIEKQQIQSGFISLSTNSFMLKGEILSHLKDVFDHCPKYCSNFVKVSHFCMQVNQSQSSKYYLNEVVKNLPQIVTVKQILSSLMSHPYKFLDLDEILSWFSIKGFPITVENHQQQLQQAIDSDDSFEERKKQKEKNKKLSERGFKKQHKRVDSKVHTLIKEFNLTKKTKETIQQQRLKQMLEQAQAKQKQQMSKQFKANPIPSSINNEKYQEYRAKMQSSKDAILSKLNKSKEQDNIILQYLQANTKLFQKKTKINYTEPIQYTFKAEPIPWFVHANLYEQINESKEEKKSQSIKKNKFKYINEWKNLPSFIIDSNNDDGACTTKNPSQKNLLSQLKENQEGLLPTQTSKLLKKSKVKDVPNFKLLQQQFLQELEVKKKYYKPTTIEQFNLSSPRAKENIGYLQGSKKSSTKESDSLAAKLDKSKTVKVRDNFIGSTLKYESLVQANYQKRVYEELKKIQQMKQQQQRLRQRQIFAKLVRKEFKKERYQNKKSTKSNKSRANSQQSNAKKEMAEMYRRVFSRPFLFQSVSSSRAKQHSREKKARPIEIRNLHSSEESNRYIQQLHLDELISVPRNQPDQIENESVSRNSI